MFVIPGACLDLNPNDRFYFDQRGQSMQWIIAYVMPCGSDIVS